MGELLSPPLQINSRPLQKVPHVNDGFLYVLFEKLFGEAPALFLNTLQNVIDINHRSFHLGRLKRLLKNSAGSSRLGETKNRWQRDMAQSFNSLLSFPLSSWMI
jgi:hypothetical protein